MTEKMLKATIIAAELHSPIAMKLKAAAAAVKKS